MKESEVRERAFAMPLTNPAYPPGPYRFRNREFLIITYRTDSERLRAVVPEPLEVEASLVRYEFIRMPDSTGSRLAVPAPHALAPVAELPVLEVVSALHILSDLTLGLGKVVHDYLG